MIEVLLLTHSAATLIMVGVIWFVQIVHYPLMAKVSSSEQWHSPSFLTQSCWAPLSGT